MGIGSWLKDSLKDVSDETKHEKRCRQDLSMPLNIKFGNEQLRLPAIVTLRQKSNGKVYFNYDTHVRFYLIAYSWNGARYSVSTTTSKTSKETGKSNSKTNGHILGSLTGAAVGTLIGPAGTIAGAIIGGSGKDKTKGKQASVSKTNTVSNTNTSEIKTLANLTLQSVKTGKIYTISLNWNTEADSKLKCFRFYPERSADEVIEEYHQSKETEKDFYWQ